MTMPCASCASLRLSCLCVRKASEVTEWRRNPRRCASCRAWTICSSHPRMAAVPAAHALALKAAREAVAETRARLLAGESAVDVSADAVASRAAEILERAAARSLRRAVNATGVLLHTNLGRAPLSDAAQQALADVAAGFSNLQADLGSGRRSEREDHVQGLFQALTGAEAALVVNNNAAATVLVLNTLAAGREVIVSRGEMVEIGGAFRIPEILKLAGCRLVEVGCTNRTHLRDYERAITPETGLILSVHQSNYRIVGFAEQAPVARAGGPRARARRSRARTTSAAARCSTCAPYGLPHEPTVPESLAAGADVTLFSGDKLLGGPQCGIILGKKAPLAAMHKNPFYRAFRVGKLTLAALEATLRLFLEPETLLEKHRLMSLLTAPARRNPAPRRVARAGNRRVVRGLAGGRGASGRIGDRRRLARRTSDPDRRGATEAEGNFARRPRRAPAPGRSADLHARPGRLRGPRRADHAPRRRAAHRPGAEADRERDGQIVIATASVLGS